MISEIEKYFIPNEEATFVTREGRLCHQSINRKGNARVPKAIEQAGLNPVPVEQIIELINEFLNSLCDKNPETGCNGYFNLEGREHVIIDNVLRVDGCSWKPPVYDKVKRRYTFHDKKYDEIQKGFNLEYPNDIVWLKFTTDGYLGVVADSFDINYDYDNTSGKLLGKLKPEKKWDNSFVIIVPITAEMKRKRTRKEIETAIGEYLIKNKVPIIDYYSHNNFFF